MSQTRKTLPQDLYTALDSGALSRLRVMLGDLDAAEIAQMLESFPPAERMIAWRLIDPDEQGEVLLHLHDEVREGLIRNMSTDELVGALEELDIDDLAEILEDLPGVVARELMQAMDAQDRKRLAAVMAYDDDTAGGLMSTDTLTVRTNVSLEVVLRYLRRVGEMPEPSDSLIVVDRNDHYKGVLPLTVLLTRDPEALVDAVMDREVEPIAVDLAKAAVAKLFEHRDLVSAPVVDAQGRLVGRITIDDVVDVIRAESEHNLMAGAGLDEQEDVFAPVWRSALRRAVWLGTNLLTALLAARVVGAFTATIEQIVALAVLMPIVASMGGIAGTQTLTLMIRSQALGQINSANVHRFIVQQIAVVLLNALLWASVVAGVAWFWFKTPSISAIIAAALILNLTVAAIAGCLVPLLLQRLRIDPALAGSVIVTTITDVLGFFALLGLATWFLL